MDGCMSRCKDDKMEGGMSKIDGCMDSYDWYWWDEMDATSIV